MTDPLVDLHQVAETDDVRVGRPGTPLRTLRARSMPARWRITAWIILSTMVTLVAVGMIGRSIFVAGVERAANTEIEQEADEFIRFSEKAGAEGLSTPEQLLQEYVARQVLHDEVVVGIVDGSIVAVANGLTGANSVSGGSAEVPGGDGLVGRLLDSNAASGVVETGDTGPARWGRLEFTSGDSGGTLVILQFTQDARAQVDESFTGIAWAALLGLLLSSGVAWLVAGQILAPVRDVYRVARDIGEHDLTARVPVDGSDDIAAVATTFNQMLDRLEAVHATQQKFVDDAGHELRTPITIVRGHLELLSDDPEERKASLRLISDELDRMSRIVTDLLVLARAQQPDFVRVASCDVTALTLDIEAKAQALGARRWQLMEVAEGSVRLDPQRVTQAVLQFAANAVQVTDEDDRIRMGSRFEGNGTERLLRLWVQDTGPGVLAEDAERIFERFVRGSARGDTVGRHGSGLGLAIVRAITDGHGGSAWVDSVPGKGATFGIDIPAPIDARESAAGEWSPALIAERN